MSARRAVIPLQCAACGAGVPLVRAPETRCPFCKAAVPVPPAYLDAAAMAEAEEQVRREVEPRWAELTEPPSARWSAAGMAFVALLPPVATLVAQLASEVPPGRVTVLARVALPALLPGAVLWLRGGVVAATVVRLRRRLAAAPPARGGEAPACRSCGGALAVTPGALAATCGYCGTDSLLGEVPAVEARERRSGALATLAEAAGALRARRALLTLGLVGAALVVGGLSIALSLAMRGTVGG